jgi:Cu+-exporting ATPase
MMVERKSKEAKLKISGMTCVMCAQSIEKSLSNLKGVKNVVVSLGNEQAAVVYDNDKLKLADFERAVKDAGYDVVNEKAVVKVGGMTCATCVMML